jgi:hypothetical protein
MIECNDEELDALIPYYAEVYGALHLTHVEPAVALLRLI